MIDWKSPYVWLYLVVLPGVLSLVLLIGLPIWVQMTVSFVAAWFYGLSAIHWFVTARKKGPVRGRAIVFGVYGVFIAQSAILTMTGYTLQLIHQSQIPKATWLVSGVLAVISGCLGAFYIFDWYRNRKDRS